MTGPPCRRSSRSFYGRWKDTWPTDELHALYAEDGGLETAAAALIDGIELYGTEDADEFMNADVFPLARPRSSTAATPSGRCSP